MVTGANKIVTPQSKKREVMERYHDHKLAGHLGYEKTILRINK